MAAKTLAHTAVPERVEVSAGMRYALLVLAAVLEHLGYRQLTVWWRVRAFWEFWRGDLSWGVMERRGVGTA